MSQLELSTISALRNTPIMSPSDVNGGGQRDNKTTTIPYPKSVFFIIATELSERFSYYGMRAVLTIYMRNVLKFSEDEATTMYHTFLLLCYGLPIFWGIIADSFLGKYKTIWLVSICFALGNIVLTLSSIPPLNLPAIPLTIVGLILMSIGTGGMKPCCCPFGAEQFVLPQQNKYLQQFFSVFFFAVTVGNMISTIITPVFRRDIHCFSMDSCYPLAFGVPACSMIFAVGVFVAGKPLYKINKPQGNMLIKVVRCITHALVNKKSSVENKSHWLDHAEDTFDAGLIKDIKMLLRVLIYYIPIPMFFALYEQLGSRWTLQATRMTGQIGNFTIKPDQMQVSNAILMFVFIPVFQAVVYPIFGKCKLLRRPLQRMVVGGLLAALSFLVAGLVEMKIEKNHYIPPGIEDTHLKFVNTLPCPVIMHKNGSNETTTINAEAAEIIKLLNSPAVELKVGLTLSNNCSEFSNYSRKWEGSVGLMKGSLQTVFIFAKDNSLTASVSSVKEDFKNSNEGNAKLRITVNGILPFENSSISSAKIFSLNSHENEFDLNIAKESNDFSYTLPSELPPGEYLINSNFIHNATSEFNSGQKKRLGFVDLKPGGSYLLVVHPDYDINNRSSFKLQMIVLNSPNEVHMLWLIPQYVLMAWAEILFIVSGMEFSFTEAPKSMKSVLQSLWHLMNAIGNVIVILSAQTKVSHSQAIEFFEFSGAMLIDTLIFLVLAMRYTYHSVAPIDTTPTKSRDPNDNQDKN